MDEFPLWALLVIYVGVWWIAALLAAIDFAVEIHAEGGFDWRWGWVVAAGAGCVAVVLMPVLAPLALLRNLGRWVVRHI